MDEEGEKASYMLNCIKLLIPSAKLERMEGITHKKITFWVNIIFEPAHNNITIANGVFRQGFMAARQKPKGKARRVPGRPLEKFVPCRKCERTWK